MRITKQQWEELGGLRNGELWRRQLKSGRITYNATSLDAAVRVAGLIKLREAADEAGAMFDAACATGFVDGRWGYYRAMEGFGDGRGVTDEMHAACDALTKARHAYFSARDGDA